MWWQKLTLVLMIAAAVVLGWARGATPAQASGPSMSLGISGDVLCDDPVEPTECTTVVLTSTGLGFFDLTIDADVIPESYLSFQAQLFFSAQFQYAVALDCDGLLWPEGVKCFSGNEGSQFSITVLSAAFPPFQESTYVGPLWSSSSTFCESEAEIEIVLTAWPSSGTGAYYIDSNVNIVPVKTVSTRELDLDGDTTTELVDIADSLRITCISANADLDVDHDGCSEAAELSTDPATGGRRNPLIFWDFYDTPDASNVRDKAVTIGDIFAIIPRFGATGDPGGDPLAGPIPPAPGYHTAFDRGEQVGENSWNRAPADGAITIQDIFAVAAQFGHDCR